MKGSTQSIFLEEFPHIRGGGGGRPTFAQGGGSNPDGLPDALDAAKNLIGV